MKLPMYVLEFEDPAGTEGRFNTLRLGRAWANRLSKGDRVLLINSKTKSAFAVAKVETVECDRAHRTLLKHAANNHLELALNDPEGAYERRFQSLMRRYGPAKFDGERYLTAIYLRRMKR